ncbi:response regulator [Thiohalocapsa marina]|uniref:Chemotaxis protein CheA n=1 Tax=Thiohalocapsa marina TaxID=424902 RepID=A0A5M8FIW7_9GAMM|nr:response regulator [Thiohalocapsa marina]KAA6184617.1 response regulator [Thiohalocapsa marina]
MSLIEDKDLRDLFRAESAEHIQQIESGLITLERSPEDEALLTEVFREAHSLKGAARMLGLNAIQGLAHGLESLLDDARQGKARITADLVAPQLAQLDEIRRLVAQAVGEVPETAPEAPEPAARPAPEPAATSAAAATPPVRSPPAAGVADLQIDTLRIDAARLDTMVQLGGELIVANGRIACWQADLERLLHGCEARLRALAALPADERTPWADLCAELHGLRGRVVADAARLHSVAAALEGDIRDLRLLPMSTLLELFPRMVRDLAAELGKQVAFEVKGGSVVADKRVIEEMKPPLMHLLRNAIDHGIESPQERRCAGKAEQGVIRVHVTQDADAVRIRLSDDGRGLDPEAIRRQALKQGLLSAEALDGLSMERLQALILQPGFSTSSMVTDISGRGVGLDVVRTAVERLRGSLRIVSTLGQGLTLELRLPVSLTATRALLLHEWGVTYALPFDEVRLVRRLQPTDLHWVEGRQCLYQGEHAVPVERLGRLLQRAPPADADTAERGLQCVLLEVGGETFALTLDAVSETEEIVVKPLAPPLRRVRTVAGLAILGSGAVCVVLSAYDLLRSQQRLTRQRPPDDSDDGAAETARRVLLVEDSITTRLQERRILEAAGYQVVTAADGLDAWGKLSSQRFDAVVSDIEMPRMSGLELTGRIRGDRRLAELPVILVTSLAKEQDRRRGLELGADAYISKPEFEQDLLLDCLARFI